MDYTIRSAKADDVEAMYHMSCEIHIGLPYKNLIPTDRWTDYVNHYTETDRKKDIFCSNMIHRLSNKSWQVYVAVSKKTILGYTLVETGSVWRLKGLFVSTKNQGIGIGQRLFRKSYYDAPIGTRVELTVLRDNESAIELYVKNGFEMQSIAKKYFYGAEQIIMHKKIDTNIK